MASNQKRFQPPRPVAPGAHPFQTEHDRALEMLNDYIRRLAARLTTLDGTVTTLVGTGSMTSLNGATAPGAGTGFNLTTAYANFSMQVTGTGTGLSINLQGSLDGTTWNDIGSAATANGLFTFSGTPVTWIRANLAAITGGSVTVILAAA